MRVIAILLPLLVLGAAPPSAQPAQTEPKPVVHPFAPPLPDCRKPTIASSDGRALFQRLGDLPPADAYQAVLRSGPDGCADPLLVSERIGWSRPQPRK